jgi:hypothetical protein
MTKGNHYFTKSVELVKRNKNGATVLSITTLRITAHSVITFSITINKT